MKSLRKILETLVVDSVALYAKIDEYEFVEDADGIKECVDKLEDLCEDASIQITKMFNKEATVLDVNYLTGAEYLIILRERLKVKLYDYANDDIVLPF